MRGKNYDILPGMGLDQKSQTEAITVLQTVAGIHGYRFEFEEHAIGGVAIKSSDRRCRELRSMLVSRPTQCCSAL